MTVCDGKLKIRSIISADTSQERFIPTQAFLASNCIERSVERRKIYYIPGDGLVQLSGSSVSFSGEIRWFVENLGAKAIRLMFSTKSQKDLLSLVTHPDCCLGIHLATWDTNSPSLLYPRIKIGPEIRGKELAKLRLRRGVDPKNRTRLVLADDVNLEQSDVVDLARGIFRTPVEVVDLLVKASVAIASYRENLT